MDAIRVLVGRKAEWFAQRGHVSSVSVFLIASHFPAKYLTQNVKINIAEGME